MPRAPRIDIPGLTYHVISRGVRKWPLFNDDHDRQQLLRFLSMTRHEFPFKLHAYSLMGNHYHFLLQTLECSLSKTMCYFKTLYASYFNRKHGHVGHVFQGRFHSIPVENDAYFTTVASYIHLNAVRAGIVDRPEAYPWTDYGRLIRGEADPLVDSSFLLDYFGRDTGKQRDNYRRFVEEKIGRKEPVSERILFRMRFWGKPPEELDLRKSHIALSQQTF